MTNVSDPIDAQRGRGARITSEAIANFHKEGYLLLERCISDEDVAMMRGACDELIAQGKSHTDNSTNGRAHKFLFGAAAQKPVLDRFNFGPLMAELCRATIGPDAWHVNDQFSFKDARSGGTFHWHQDGGYIGAPHAPYLTVWIALCDMSEHNGTVRVVPRSRALVKETVRGAKELVSGYQRFIGNDPGDPVVVPAGSLAAFRSDIFHASTNNDSDAPRIAYITQYAPEAVLGKPDQGLWIKGRPFLKDGRVIASA